MTTNLAVDRGSTMDDDRWSIFAWRPLAFAFIGALLALWPVLLEGGAVIVMEDTVSYLDKGVRLMQFLATSLREATSGAPGSVPALREVAHESTSLRSLPYTAFMGVLAPAGPIFALWVQTALTLLVAVAVARDVLDRPWWAGVLLGAVMLVATPLPFMASFLMPDIFGAVVVLFGVLLVRGFDRLTRASQLALSLIAVFAVGTHYGNIPLAAAIVGTALLLVGGRGRTAVLAVAVVAMAVAGNVFIGMVAFDSASVAPRRLPILLARSLEDGPARWYLEEACPTRDYAVCSYWEGGEFPERVGDALWGPRGLNSAEPATYARIQDEEAEILWHAFRAYPLQQGVSLARNGFRQLGKTGTRYVMTATISGVEEAATRFETPETSRLGPVLDAFGQLHLASYLLGTTALGALFFFGRRRPGERGAIAVLAVGIVGNAFIFGGLSAPVDRYQARVAWTVPLIALIILIERTGPGRLNTARGVAGRPRDRLEVGLDRQGQAPRGHDAAS
jgi:hypothetical protein